MTNNFKFTFGKHKGKTLDQVRKEEPSYLFFVKNNFKNVPNEITDYIESNLKQLTEEVRRERRDFLYKYCNGESNIEY